MTKHFMVVELNATRSNRQKQCMQSIQKMQTMSGRVIDKNDFSDKMWRRSIKNTVNCT